MLPRGNVLRVLDIKAGEQRFEIRQPMYVVGVDVVQAERGRRPDADEHRVMDLERVELEHEECDVVLCVNVLEHAREPVVLLKHVGNALKGGGTFVVVMPNVASLKGFVVRLIPWRLQRWIYVRVLRSETVRLAQSIPCVCGPERYCVMRSEADWRSSTSEPTKARCRNPSATAMASSVGAGGSSSV